MSDLPETDYGLPELRIKHLWEYGGNHIYEVAYLEDGKPVGMQNCKTRQEVWDFAKMYGVLDLLEEMGEQALDIPED